MSDNSIKIEKSITFEYIGLSSPKPNSVTSKRKKEKKEKIKRFILGDKKEFNKSKKSQSEKKLPAPLKEFFRFDNYSTCQDLKNIWLKKPKKKTSEIIEKIENNIEQNFENLKNPGLFYSKAFAKFQQSPTLCNIDEKLDLIFEKIKGL